jgi:hypothetical protein
VSAQKCWVAKYGDRLAERIVIIRSEENGDSLPAARDLETLMGTSRLFHEPRKLGAGFGNRQRRHVHNCSALDGALDGVEGGDLQLDTRNPLLGVRELAEDRLRRGEAGGRDLER